VDDEDEYEARKSLMKMRRRPYLTNSKHKKICKRSINSKSSSILFKEVKQKVRIRILRQRVLLQILTNSQNKRRTHPKHFELGVSVHYLNTIFKEQKTN